MKFVNNLSVYILFLAILLGIIFICPIGSMCQSNDYTQFSVINRTFETGKIYFKGDFIDSVKYQVFCDSTPCLEDWKTCKSKVLNLSDTIFPKRDCIIYIKAFSGVTDIPQSVVKVDYKAILKGMIKDYNPKVFDMLVVNPSNPLRGTKLIVDSMRFQSKAICSGIVQKAIQNDYEIELELYDDVLPLTSPVLPKIKSIEFIKPKD